MRVILCTLGLRLFCDHLNLQLGFLWNPKSPLIGHIITISKTPGLKLLATEAQDGQGSGSHANNS